MRVRLFWVMILIALIAVGLRAPVWFHASGLSWPPGWWQTYRQRQSWREQEKVLRDAWTGPITLYVTRHDDLGTVLHRFNAATVRPGLRHGLVILVDPGGLHEAGLTLGSPIGTDLDARGIPAREFLDRVLKPLGLTGKLGDWEQEVRVTSVKSPNERLFRGDHGEVFCDHNLGPWVSIQTIVSHP